LAIKKRQKFTRIISSLTLARFELILILLHDCISVCLAAKAAELLETLKDKLNDSSSNVSSRPSSPSCDCDCHYDSWGGSSDGEGCEGCYDYHEDSYGYGGNWNMFGGWGRYVLYIAL